MASVPANTVEGGTPKNCVLADEARTTCEPRSSGESMVRMPFRSGCRLEQFELSQRGNAVIETDLLDDLAVDDLQHRRTREVHLATRRRRKATDQEIVERRPGVGAAAFPLTDDIIPLGDQISGAP